MILRHYLSGKHITNKEQAVQAFYEDLRAANGARRQDPKDYAKVQQVRCKEGAWVVYYSVPSRIIRSIFK